MLARSSKLRLEAWSRHHALVMLVGSAAAAAFGRPWPALALAVVSFGALIWHAAGAWTAKGHFGWANAVTTLRLALIVMAGFSLHAAPGELLGAVVLGVFALDAVDGWIARRTKSTSAFGAQFDMETDALLVLALSLELWLRGQFGAWVLMAGLWRYLYVLWLACLPGHAPPMPRSRLARYAFGILLVGLAGGLVFDNAFGRAAAVFGTAVVSLSFLRSFYWSWLNTLPVPEDAPSAQ